MGIESFPWFCMHQENHRKTKNRSYSNCLQICSHVRKRNGPAVGDATWNLMGQLQRGNDGTPTECVRNEIHDSGLNPRRIVKWFTYAPTFLQRTHQRSAPSKGPRQVRHNLGSSIDCCDSRVGTLIHGPVARTCASIGAADSRAPC